MTSHINIIIIASLVYTAVPATIDEIHSRGYIHPLPSSISCVYKCISIRAVCVSACVLVSMFKSAFPPPSTACIYRIKGRVRRMGKNQEEKKEKSFSIGRRDVESRIQQLGVSRRRRIRREGSVY